MLDFRKLLLASALLMISSATVFAQNTTLPLSCIAQAAGTNSIRAEGLAELVGDVLITCTGGTPTPYGQPLPQVNIEIFTDPVINITSRALGSGAETEALLFVDEPVSNRQLLCGSTNAPTGAIQGVCTSNTGTGLLPNTGLTTNNPYYAGAPARPNAFIGNRVTVGNAAFAATRLIWQGIQFDPPGTQGQRTLRLTNIRVNANMLNVSEASQQAVRLLISTSPSGPGNGGVAQINPIQLPITQPSPTVAFAQRSLAFSSKSGTGLQCYDGNVNVDITFTELFASAWRRRSAALSTGYDDSPAPINSDQFGSVFQTETGFYKTSTSSNWDTLSNVAGQPGAGVGSNILGLADSGTRLIARWRNIQAGVVIKVPTVLSLTGGGYARLISTNTSGAGNFVPVGTGSLAATSTIHGAGDGSTAVAVWEILSTQTTAFEVAVGSVNYSWKPNLPTIPGLGLGSEIAGDFAPISTVPTSSSTAPIPRFVERQTYGPGSLTINTCRSNLLFPFVSNQSGFDTGFAISNTTKDPFGTGIQSGPCKIYFYGNVNGSKIDGSNQTTASITGGEHLVFSLANGGAITPVAGFQGYVIASCDFQYAHGYAFISDLGAQKLAQGYLALVLDTPFSSYRTGSVSEALNN